MNKLRLHTVSSGICRVLTDSGLHVGNLKLIGGVWKFKAIGYNTAGQVIPGGGPLTKRHNAVFKTPDPADVDQILGLNML